MATCDASDRESIDAAGENVIAHPWLVVEILSPSTASDDLTTKMDSYQSIPDVTHYLVIDSRRRAMRIFERTKDEKFTGSGSVAAVTFSRLDGFELKLEDVYRDTSVPSIENVAPTD